jgi:UDP-2,3-diacylglucosamine pyrophosphatase LpxH
MHGDQLDGIVSCAPWLTKLGDAMYDFTVMLSHSVNNLRRAMHRPYWPVAERIKLSDWVESCSALVEKHSGELELLRWPHAAAGVRRPTAELLPDAA